MATLAAKGPYDLKAVVFSHGWSDLAPFQVRSEDGSLRVALRSTKGPVDCTVRPVRDGLSVEGSFQEADLRWMFRLDDDLASFYSLAKKEGRPWIGKFRMGRLLRSQTVFEDLVKLVLTTNCSWSLTRLMTDRLAERLGEKTPGGLSLFPSPEALTSQTERFYREEIRAGYRSPHLRKLGDLVVRGKVDPESWRDPSIPTEELRKQILSLPGAGPYVADNLLRYLGRYERLGLDSWARGTLKEQWKMKKIPADSTIERKYKPFSDFRGLVLWCDLTRGWFTSGDFKSWIRTDSKRPDK